MALRIKSLLYDEGYTIPGARQVFKAELKQKEPQLALAIDNAPRPSTSASFVNSRKIFVTSTPSSQSPLPAPQSTPSAHRAT